MPSELEDEDVKLAVVLRPGASLDPEELVEFCTERLPRFMVPRYVEFLDSLPRTPTDKVAKYRLRGRGRPRHHVVHLGPRGRSRGGRWIGGS